MGAQRPKLIRRNNDCVSGLLAKIKGSMQGGQRRQRVGVCELTLDRVFLSGKYPLMNVIMGFFFLNRCAGKLKFLLRRLDHLQRKEGK